MEDNNTAPLPHDQGGRKVYFVFGSLSLCCLLTCVLSCCGLNWWDDQTWTVFERDLGNGQDVRIVSVPDEKERMFQRLYFIMVVTDRHGRVPTTSESVLIGPHPPSGLETWVIDEVKIVLIKVKLKNFDSTHWFVWDQEERKLEETSFKELRRSKYYDRLKTARPELFQVENL